MTPVGACVAPTTRNQPPLEEQGTHGEHCVRRATETRFVTLIDLVESVGFRIGRRIWNPVPLRALARARKRRAQARRAEERGRTGGRRGAGAARSRGQRRRRARPGGLREEGGGGEEGEGDLQARARHNVRGEARRVGGEALFHPGRAGRARAARCPFPSPVPTPPLSTQNSAERAHAARAPSSPHADG